MYRTMFLLLVLLSGCTAIEKAALPDAKVRDIGWQDRDPGSTVLVDHGAWDAFLSSYVKTDAEGINRVDYAAVTPPDKAALDGYIAALEAVAVDRLNGPEQLAFWINLYNAETVQTVLEHYPVNSIRQIKFTNVIKPGPWWDPLVTVGGKPLTLNQIEHEIVRPIWSDPRIHYALNCAARQCPNLAKQAFRAASLEAQLNAAARAYVNDPRGVTVSDDGYAVVLSKIYAWFVDDFGGSEQTVLAHLGRYADGELAEVLADDPDIDDYVYDWQLNDTRFANQ